MTSDASKYIFLQLNEDTNRLQNQFSWKGHHSNLPLPQLQHAHTLGSLNTASEAGVWWDACIMMVIRLRLGRGNLQHGRRWVLSMSRFPEVHQAQILNNHSIHPNHSSLDTIMVCIINIAVITTFPRQQPAQFPIWWQRWAHLNSSRLWVAVC